MDTGACAKEVPLPAPEAGAGMPVRCATHMQLIETYARLKVSMRLVASPLHTHLEQASPVLG